MTSRPAMRVTAIGRATPPPAWADRQTRRLVRRQLWATIAFLLVATVGVTATVLVVAQDGLDQPWGLPVLTAIGGLAGGALAGGITQLVLFMRVRGFLRDGPWLAAAMTLADGRYARLNRGPDSVAVRLDVATAKLGASGDQLVVEVRSDGGPHLITVPPSRRLVRAVTTPTAAPLNQGGRTRESV